VHFLTTFASDSDPKYLKKTTLICLCLGTVILARQEKLKILEKHILLISLIPSQFQYVDFLFPFYEMTTQREVSNVSFIHSKLPSRSGDGHLSNGEAFGRLTSEVMQLAGQHNSLAP
jgi:hypothetical protein